jgi:hypothetical protein
MMVMPSGRRRSEPVPVATKSGAAPNSAAMVVMMIGRKWAYAPVSRHGLTTGTPAFLKSAVSRDTTVRA